MLINLRNALMAGKRTPTVEYLSYIQSDGAAWVDTGYIPQYYDSFEIEMAAAAFSSASLTFQTSFFGCTPSSANDSFSLEPSYIFSPAATDRQFALLPPFSNRGGGNARFWNATANDGNTYLDEQFHKFTIAAYPASVPSQITIDGIYNVVLTQTSWANGTVSPLSTSVAIFGCKTEQGTCKFKTSPQTKLRFRRLKFFNSSGALVADLRAARLGSDFGVYDDVSQTFHPGIDGTITGA